MVEVILSRYKTIKPCEQKPNENTADIIKQLVTGVIQAQVWEGGECNIKQHNILLIKAKKPFESIYLAPRLCTHTLAPHQTCRVVLFDERLHLSPDQQVGAHPVHMTSVSGRDKRITVK